MKLLHVPLLALSTLPALLAAPLAADTVTLQASADTSLYEESGALGNGAGMHMFCGKTQLDKTRRALVRFDLAAVPAGSAIASARLVLHLSQQNTAGEIVTIHALSADWGEGASDAPGAEGQGTAALPGDATWTERFFGMGQAWSTPGGTFGPGLASTLVGGVADWNFESAALTAAVQAMLDAPATNFGFIVRGPESFGTAMRFDTRENPNPAVRPRLVVTFTPPCPAPATYCVGAPNSVGAGASIGWGGSTSIGAQAFTLNVAGIPPGTSGLFFFGPGAAATPFGDGFLCVTGPHRRLGLQFAAAGGGASRTLDFVSTPSNAITAGTTWRFQFLYRDVAQGAAGFNLSNGLVATFCP